MASRQAICGALLVALVCAHEAAAQGKGRPKAPKAPKAPAATTSSPTTAPAAAGAVTPSSPVMTPVDAASPVPSFRQFGSWLDDASAGTAGEGRTGIGIGYWRVGGGSQINVPMLDVGYAFTDRVQASMSVPFYRSSFDGATARGLDDIYLAGKVTLIDPSLTVSELGVAISPVVEVLSPGSDQRLHYGLPVSVELRRLPFRVYGSAGYFSRGALFTAGAVEWNSASGYVLSGAITQSYSTQEDAALDTLGVGRRRADVSGSVAHALGRSAAAYVSVGRTLTSMDEGGTSFSLSGGISFRFAAATATP